MINLRIGLPTQLSISLARTKHFALHMKRYGKLKKRELEQRVEFLSFIMSEHVMVTVDESLSWERVKVSEWINEHKGFSIVIRNIFTVDL